MEPNIMVAVIAATSAVFGGLLGGLVTASANYLVSRRQISRSGARLLTDLEILEKARAVQLDPLLIAAIERYVRQRVEWHAHTPIGD